MRGSHFAIQLFAAFLFYMVHFKMRAKVCSLKVQAERISKSVHSKGAHFFFGGAFQSADRCRTGSNVYDLSGIRVCRI